MLQTERVLVLAPHTDDGELGCGATIAKYKTAAKHIIYVAFSTCSQSLPPGLPANTLAGECRLATGVLGIADVRLLDFPVRHFPAHRQEILEALVQLKKELDPHLVFLPAQNDIHQDHQVIYAEGLRAFKNTNVLGYELPWNNTAFAPTYFEKIDPVDLRAKQAALTQYQSQMHRRYMNPDFIAALATVRGIQCNAEYAEAFEVYRLSS